MNLIWEWAKENLDLDEMTRAKFEELAHEKWKDRVFECFSVLPLSIVMCELVELDKAGEGISFERLPPCTEMRRFAMDYLIDSRLVSMDADEVVRINYDNLLRLVGSK